ncbi:MAG: ion transporter [Bacteroidetes bacterium]|nr:ion transporter [Bacteroidota bacterium]
MRKKIVSIFVILSVIHLALITYETLSVDYELQLLLFDSIITFVFLLDYIFSFKENIPSNEYSLKHLLKFLLSPKAIIDLISILPFFLFLFYGDYSVFFLLRLVRIFRLMNLSNHHNLLLKAIKNKKQELIISMQVVLTLTLILSAILYFSEKDKSDNFSNIVEAFLWSISKLISGIAGYGDYVPVSVFGKFIGTLVGILTIAVFAVPTGIIASGFVEEIDNQKEENELKNQEKMLITAFSEKRVPKLDMFLRRGALNVEAVEVKLNISKSELIKIIRSNNQFRLRSKALFGDHSVIDSTFVEFFDVNTSYGYNSNINSDLTILSTDSFGEQSIGYFTYCLSKKLNANFLSNEFYGDSIYVWNEEFHNDDLLSGERGFQFKSSKAYFNQNKNENPIGVPPAFFDFKNDLKNTIKPGSYCFLIRATSSKRKNAFHIIYGGKKGQTKIEIENSTFRDFDKLEGFISELKQQIEENFIDKNYLVTTHEEFGTTSDNVINYIHETCECNVIQVMINIDLIAYETFQTVKLLSDTIEKCIICENK